VISGDVMHSTIQCLKPEWNFVYDHDKDLAAVTRRAFLEMVCETDKVLLGSHFPLPSFGRLRPAAEAFSWLEH